MAYSDKERTEALVRLAVNNYDYAKTASETGINHQTLRNWDKQFGDVAVPELLDRAIRKILSVVPAQMPAKEWAVAFGILMDKWLVLRGEPTSRSEIVSRIEEQLPSDPGERDAVLQEARAYIERLGEGGDSSGPIQENGRPASG